MSKYKKIQTGQPDSWFRSWLPSVFDHVDDTFLFLAVLPTKLPAYICLCIAHIVQA